MGNYEPLKNLSIDQLRFGIAGIEKGAAFKTLQKRLSVKQQCEVIYALALSDPNPLEFMKQLAQNKIQALQRRTVKQEFMNR